MKVYTLIQQDYESIICLENFEKETDAFEALMSDIEEQEFENFCYYIKYENITVKEALAKTKRDAKKMIRFYSIYERELL